MYQKFQPEDKVRHHQGTIVMTVTRYEMKREYTEPVSLLGNERKYRDVPTDTLNCRWFDKESNLTREKKFYERDLVKVDDNHQDSQNQR